MNNLKQFINVIRGNYILTSDEIEAYIKQTNPTDKFTIKRLQIFQNFLKENSIIINSEYSDIIFNLVEYIMPESTSKFDKGYFINPDQIVDYDEFEVYNEFKQKIKIVYICEIDDALVEEMREQGPIGIDEMEGLETCSTPYKDYVMNMTFTR